MLCYLLCCSISSCAPSRETLQFAILSLVFYQPWDLKLAAWAAAWPLFRLTLHAELSL